MQISFIFPCLLLFVLWYGVVEVAGDDIDENEKGEEHLTPHRKLLAKTYTELSGIDLNGNPQESAQNVITEITKHDLHNRISTLYENAVTPECRALIGEHFGYFINALALEESFPFADIRFNNTCENDIEYDFNNLPPGIHMGHINNRTYRPPRDEATYIASNEVVLCYGVLAHDSASATIRLIEAVDEPTTMFLVHVDGKFDDTHAALKQYAADKPRIKVLDHPHRVRVNWGGFSMVNATMQLLHFADRMVFTHFVHIASTAYPIASNRRIRNTIASFPMDANFMHVVMKPNNPEPSIWNYFVECDDALHRIYRMPIMRKETHGAHFYTSSQWFMISKAFASYLANPEPGSFLEQYLEYAQHVVVSDESFFGTVLRNTPFCHKHHNNNFLHLQFDQWENERNLELRDKRKCVMPNPDHCGRSPTTITTDYIDILELSEDLYARKFLDDVDSNAKDIIDSIREAEQNRLTSQNITEAIRETPKVQLLFDGHGALLVAKETVDTSMPMCLGLGPTQNKVRLVPCFYEWVPQTLAPDWETGAVILDETPSHNRWYIPECSSDGNLERLENGEIKVETGNFSSTGPRCMFQMMDGVRAGRCLDGEALDTQPGGPVHVYPCTKVWHQFLSFGNGIEVPKGALFTTVPLHTRKRIAETGREQSAYMCLGVAGRGELDEEDWLGERGEAEEESDDDDDDEEEESDDEVEDEGYPPLWKWEGEQLIATTCSNVGAVIEWIAIPFIVEETVPEDSNAEVQSEDEEL